ncbi:MAG: hypothetical protein PUC24_01050, partial [Oscillospiraceae bacterium]|nr:hypothetical protein [Oscillospiraceae bacterium]
LFFAILHQIMQSVYEESGRNFIEMRPARAIIKTRCAAVPAQLLHRVRDRAFAGKSGRAVRRALRIIRMLPFLVKSGNFYLMVDNYVNLW